MTCSMGSGDLLRYFDSGPLRFPLIDFDRDVGPRCTLRKHLAQLRKHSPCRTHVPCSTPGFQGPKNSPGPPGPIKGGDVIFSTAFIGLVAIGMRNAVACPRESAEGCHDDNGQLERICGP